MLQHIRDIVLLSISKVSKSRSAVKVQFWKYRYEGIADVEIHLTTINRPSQKPRTSSWNRVNLPKNRKCPSLWLMR